MVAGTGQPEKESLNRTDQMGKAKQDKKMMICRSEMPGHDCLYMIAILGQLGHDCQDRTPVQDSQDRTSRT
jgi:hypothetical protein